MPAHRAPPRHGIVMAMARRRRPQAVQRPFDPRTVPCGPPRTHPRDLIGRQFREIGRLDDCGAASSVKQFTPTTRASPRSTRSWYS